MWVHGYKHRYHFGEGGTERVEAAPLILEVFRRPNYPGIVKTNGTSSGSNRKGPSLR